MFFSTVDWQETLVETQQPSPLLPRVWLQPQLRTVMLRAQQLKGSQMVRDSSGKNGEGAVGLDPGSHPLLSML